MASAAYVIQQPVTPAITWPTPAPIVYGTALSATQLNATAAVAGSFVYSPSSGTVLPAGQQTLHVTFTPSNTTNDTTETGSVTLTVTQATPAAGAVSSSLNPSLSSNSVTFTAGVSSAAGTPTGSIAFFDGATQLASETLSAGSATYATSALAAGSHAITAVYSGDQNFATVTSAALTQIVESFTIAAASGSSSATASAGGQAKYALVVTPPSIGAAITFSVTGLPSGATAVFSPSTIAAGAGATNVALTVNLPATASAERHQNPFRHGGWPLSLGLILLPFAGKLRRAAKTWPRLMHLPWVWLAVAGLAIAAGITACGGGSTTTKPTSNTYTLTVTANSGTLAQSTTLTLTVD